MAKRKPRSLEEVVKALVKSRKFWMDVEARNGRRAILAKQFISLLRAYFPDRSGEEIFRVFRETIPEYMRYSKKARIWIIVPDPSKSQGSSLDLDISKYV